MSGIGNLARPTGARFGRIGVYAFSIAVFRRHRQVTGSLYEIRADDHKVLLECGLVDGVNEIKLWGQQYPVRSRIHTIGGLSAHADQAGLMDWYAGFENKPPVYLVHGEHRAQRELEKKMRAQLDVPVSIASNEQVIDI